MLKSILLIYIDIEIAYVFSLLFCNTIFIISIIFIGFNYMHRKRKKITLTFNYIDNICIDILESNITS